MTATPDANSPLAIVRAKMAASELYVDYGDGLDELAAARTRGKDLLFDFSHTRPSDLEERERLLRELLGSAGEGIWVESPFSASYGSNTHVGDHFYANFNLVLVDDVEIRIGDRVMIAPNVTITTTGHPIDPVARRGGAQFSAPVIVEDDVWIGSNVSIMPGVTIGEGSVIGAGSVVTKSVPPRVVAAGTPCRVLRPIGPQDASFTFRQPATLDVPTT
ncbi:sugar O-acetyltransferase [Plantibacter sp. Mn2098]|uniref:sugar O-acetyltransferase n=1 Tax=Plantibacter sp. Mn2098 TaxID=3395266 RepID=UPI003BF572A9